MVAKGSTCRRAQTTAAALLAVVLSAYAIVRPTVTPAALNEPNDLPWVGQLAAQAASLDDLSVVDPPVEASVTFSAIDHLDNARISTSARRGQAPCTPEGKRVRCGTERWNFVGPYAARSLGQAVRCIWVHPSADRKSRRLLWPDAPLGARLQASLLLLQRSGRGRPVRARISVDDKVVARLQTKAQTRAGRVDQALPPGPPQGDLSVEIDADNNGWTLGCLSLRMRGERSPVENGRALPTRPTGGRRGH